MKTAQEIKEMSTEELLIEIANVNEYEELLKQKMLEVGSDKELISREWQLSELYYRVLESENLSRAGIRKLV